MKRLFAFLSALAGMTAFTGCGSCTGDPTYGMTHPAGYEWASQNDAIVDGKVISPMLFYGRAVVETLATGACYTDETARFELEPSVAQSPADLQTVGLLMHETRFAEQMPPLEMVAYGIDCSPATGGVAVAAERIVPQIAGTPYERYVLTGIKGRVLDLELDLTFDCAGVYRVSYIGRLLVKTDN